MKLFKTIRAVSIFEASKGIIVLLAGFGILSLIHHNVQSIAERIVNHLHLNPANQYPHIFLDFADHLQNSNMQLMAIFALAYATARFVEAFGLWFQKRWAEWFSVVSGGIYIPFEIYKMSQRITWMSLSIFTINLLIVIIMIYVLRVRATDASK